MSSLAVADVGKSGTRIRFRSEHHVGPGVDPSTGGSLPDALADAILGVAARLAESPTTLFVGTTALPALPDEWRTLGGRIAAALPATAVLVAGDVVLAHAATLGAPGVVASVGTGTVVAGMGADRAWRQWDGWGPELGDRGSAYAIGRRALRLACRHVDGLTHAPGVLSVVEEHLGHRLDLSVANRLARSATRTTDIAALSRPVAESSDDACRHLVAEAAAEVADTCIVAARTLGVVDVGLTGALGRSPAFETVVTREIQAHGLAHARPRWGILDVPESVLLGTDYAHAAVRLPRP